MIDVLTIVLVAVGVAGALYATFVGGRSFERLGAQRKPPPSQSGLSPGELLCQAAVIMVRLGNKDNVGVRDPDEIELISATNKLAIAKWLNDYRNGSRVVDHGAYDD